MSDGSAGPGLRLLFLAEGDPENPVKSGSGTPSSVIAHLRRHGAAVASADVDLRGWPRYVAAAATLSRRRAAWVARFHLSRTVLALRSRNARAAARDASPRPDAVLQYGGTFNPSPGGGGTPYFLYTDNNVLNSLREPRSWAAQMTRREVDAAVAWERELYSGAAALFMFSDFVGRSFVEDYGLAPERVVRVGCGPNLDVARIPPRRPPAQGGRAPTILFVGRDWENKGGPVVLDAFRRVRARLPDARLIVIGPPTIPVGPEPGLEFWGFLRKDVDADLARLLDAYAQADVFCLPTRYESFGIVLLEAMWFGLPVVAPGRWAIPEMVQDGVTGCLVPDERVEAYAEHLHALLADRDRAARMGEAGAARARERFSWDAVTAAMLRTIGRYVGR